VNFGPFMFDLMRDLGISSEDLAEMIGINPRTVYRWRKLKQPPRGESVVMVADALHIPLAVLRDALEGKAELPPEYRDRAKWRARRGIVGTGDANEQRAKVWAWFKSAPLAVQHAVLDVVPEGMEADYLKHVTEYFRGRLLPKGGKSSKRAG
jgi:transcriptional regulator with XRE-family HTH domain